MVNNQIAIRADGLTVVRGGRTVLDGLGFTVARSTVTGLLGPSGSGKSTLLRALVGVQGGISGTVEVLGLPAGHPRLRRRVGYVTQAPSVYADLSVRQNLEYYAAVLAPGGGRAGRRARADTVERTLAEVDLGSHAQVAAGRLSGGQLSRVSLAVALLGSGTGERPELLVLDEPTVGLDPVLRRDLWALFHRLAADGTTVLVSSHVMDEAERCERLLLLRDGRLLAEDSPRELCERTGAGTVEDAFLRLVEEARP
ncbi:ABC transporter ATP-binding protein [Peterkaempfera griseoplana]|uniref:ABC transporter ATP-binding protein n=1 Tax=Peterkaempfera griseoplana TaxID=66896 RepID=UPI0006E3D68C|nr:ABC transporter ATP-binding protein [Peterkaempfera griseoplana]